ncbi:MAG: hypothetical protein ABI697_01070 [Devosia sp.]
MLDRRPPLPSLPLLADEIAHWSVAADRCRLAALRTRSSGTASPELVADAQEAQHCLLMLLDQIAHDLEIMPAGHPDFAPLLVAQVSLTALLECVSRSLDRLLEPLPQAVRWRAGVPVAA